MPTPTATERLAHFIHDMDPAQFPSGVREQATRCVLDALGIALAGMSEPSARAARAVARNAGGREESRVLVSELGQTHESTTIETEARTMPVHRPVADGRDIERAAAILSAARRVAIVAGDAAAVSQAGPEVLTLAEALRSRWPRPWGARGLISTTHRLSAGVAGSYSAPPANRIVHGADLVLFIGCDTGDQVTLNWRIPPLSTSIVQIEVDPVEIGRSYSSESYSC